MKFRNDCFEKARDEVFDLVVIGGGVNGAAIASVASLAGLSVLVLEKNDFASGASNKTNQLLCCPVKHNEFFDPALFKVNKEEYEDKEELKRLAPHLVKDMPLLLPLSKEKTIANLKTSIGFSIKEMIENVAGNQNQAYSYVNKKDMSNLAPALSSTDYNSALLFNEGITDDSRLVFALLESAFDNGSTLINYVEVRDFELVEAKISKLNCRDRYSGEDFSVSCKYCVNASGASTIEMLRALAGPDSYPGNLALQKVVYLVLARSSFEINCACLLPADNGSLIYVLPWQHSLLVGPLSKELKEYEDCVAEKEEIESLLSILNRYSRNHKIKANELRSSFATAVVSEPAGTRSKKTEPKQASPTSFKIIESKEGMLSVAGGKLASCLSRARSVLARIFELNPEFAQKLKSKKQRQMLGAWENGQLYLALSAQIETRARRLGLDPASISHLVSAYGSKAAEILNLVEKDQRLKQRIISDYPPILAELPYAIRFEMCISLQDFLLRRTRLGILNSRLCMEAAPALSELMAELLGWKSNRAKFELVALEQELFHAEANPANL